MFRRANRILSWFLLCSMLSVAIGAKTDENEVVGNCGTRGEVKTMIIDILCKDPKDARKVLIDKMWKCKNGALDKALLQKELLVMAASDPDRPTTCQPVADIGRGMPARGASSSMNGGGGGGGGGGAMMGGGAGGAVPGAGGGAMAADDIPCTRESVDRIFQQVLCREPTQKEAFGRVWQCKQGRLGDKKLTNMLAHFILIGRETRDPSCGPMPAKLRNGDAIPMGGGGGGGGGGGLIGQQHLIGVGGGGGGGGGGKLPDIIHKPAAASTNDPLSPDECPTIIDEAFKRILCRDPNIAEKTAAVWRCRKHSESRDRVFASLAFLSRKFSVVSECPGGGYGE
jgi:hypothetical protein